MRFSECGRRPVFDTSTASEIGRIDRFVVDAADHRIHAVRVGRHKGGSILRWDEILGFGPDAVTVQSGEAVREPSEPLDEADDLLRRRLLTDEGFELGTIDDVEFDPDTGLLQFLHVGDRAVEAVGLVGSGRYAVVVRQPEDDNPR